MTKEELIVRLRDIEWDDFEVKLAKSELPKNIWETVSAFANTSGGWIVLGVKQSGKTFEIQGVDNAEKIEQDFLGTLRSGKFNQTLFATAKPYDIDGCKLIAFYVPEVDMKPVYFGNPINTFIRMGSGDQRATEGEIRAMFRNQSFGKRQRRQSPTPVWICSISTHSIITDSPLAKRQTYLNYGMPMMPSSANRLI